MVVYDDYCEESDNDGIEVCNFTSFHDDLRIRCESRGGYLYEVADIYQYITYDEFDSVVSNTTQYTVGYPFCVPQACDGADFIQDIFIPNQFYYLNSTYIYFEDNEESDNSNQTTLEPTKVIQQGFYTIESISPISNVPTATAPVSASGIKSSWSTGLAFMLFLGL